MKMKIIDWGEKLLNKIYKLASINKSSNLKMRFNQWEIYIEWKKRILWMKYFKLWLKEDLWNPNMWDWLHKYQISIWITSIGNFFKDTIYFLKYQLIQLISMNFHYFKPASKFKLQQKSTSAVYREIINIYLLNKKGSSV